MNKSESIKLDQAVEHLKAGGLNRFIRVKLLKDELSPRLTPHLEAAFLLQDFAASHCREVEEVFNSDLMLLKFRSQLQTIQVQSTAVQTKNHHIQTGKASTRIKARKKSNASKRLASIFNAIRGRVLLGKRVPKVGSGLQIYWAFRVALILLAVFCFGSGFVFVAEASSPGDSLYQVKLNLEQSSIVLAFTPEDKTIAHLNFAEKRLEELEKAFEQGRLNNLETVVSSYNKAVTEAQAINKGGLNSKIQNRLERQHALLKVLQKNTWRSKTGRTLVKSLLDASSTFSKSPSRSTNDTDNKQVRPRTSYSDRAASSSNSSLNIPAGTQPAFSSIPSSNPEKSVKTTLPQATNQKRNTVEANSRGSKLPLTGGDSGATPKPGEGRNETVEKPGKLKTEISPFSRQTRANIVRLKKSPKELDGMERTRSSPSILRRAYFKSKDAVNSVASGSQGTSTVDKVGVQSEKPQRVRNFTRG